MVGASATEWIPDEDSARAAPLDLSRLRSDLLEWYDGAHRLLPWRSAPSPYHVWLSEIMLQQTRVETVLDKGDGWTVRTRDGKLSAQFEHTILMTEKGPEVLTLTKEGPQEGHKF